MCGALPPTLTKEFVMHLSSEAQLLALFVGWWDAAGQVSGYVILELCGGRIGQFWSFLGSWESFLRFSLSLVGYLWNHIKFGAHF